MKAKIDDSIRLIKDKKADFSEEIIPKGTKGTVVEVYEQPEEGYAVDLAIPDASLVGGHRYANVILKPEDFEVEGNEKM